MGRVAVPPGRLAADALHEYALRALSRRSHTLSELEAKLRRRSLDDADVTAVLERLRAHGYLDDAKVAETHSVMRRDLHAMGPRRILAELKRRGVADATAESAVENAFRGCDESELVRAHLRRKLGTARAAAGVRGAKELARLYRALARAGFGQSAILDGLREVAADPELADALADATGEYAE